MSFEEIEKMATMVIRKRVAFRSPVSVVQIANEIGIVVGYAPHSELSGILVRSKKGALLGINSLESRVRQRFTIAHELGHYHLHGKRTDHYFSDDEKMVDCRIRQGAGKRMKQETEANVFAAALLMPRELILNEIKRIGGQKGLVDEAVSELSDIFEVSYDAMNYRLRNLNIWA